MTDTIGLLAVCAPKYECMNVLWTVKNGVFWVVTPCGSCKNRRFGGTWRLLQTSNLTLLWTGFMEGEIKMKMKMLSLHIKTHQRGVHVKIEDLQTENCILFSKLHT
jgi:hypothetical protein